jgi:hypothetical protein
VYIADAHQAVMMVGGIKPIDDRAGAARRFDDIAVERCGGGVYASSSFDNLIPRHARDDPELTRRVRTNGLAERLTLTIPFAARAQDLAQPGLDVGAHMG